MSDYASVCVFAFNRPEFVVHAIETAIEYAGVPVELIVHDDGSSDMSEGRDMRALLLAMLDQGKISHLMTNPPGHNEGKGVAINRCLGAATGDPVVLADQDLIFSSDWLKLTSEWLAGDSKIGMLGLFRYYTDPVDWRKMNHRPAPDDKPYSYVDDFVGSAMVIPRRILEEFGPFPQRSAAFAEDVAYKGRLRVAGYELALPDEDLAVNRGFGPGPSTVVYANPDGTIGVTEIHDGPRVIEPAAR